MERYKQIKVIGKGSFGKALLVQRRVDGVCEAPAALVNGCTPSGAQEKFVMKEIRMTSMSSKERKEAENEVKVLRSLRVSCYHAWMCIHKADSL